MSGSATSAASQAPSSSRTRSFTAIAAATWHRQALPQPRTWEHSRSVSNKRNPYLEQQRPKSLLSELTDSVGSSSTRSHEALGRKASLGVWDLLDLVAMTSVSAEKIGQEKAWEDGGGCTTILRAKEMSQPSG